MDPIIEVRPSQNQIDDLVEEIQVRAEADERVLVTTLTKRMAEELTKYLSRISIRCRYIHSDIDTLERVEIMQDLRRGLFDVLMCQSTSGRLRLPEVSLVAIIDADKEGFYDLLAHSHKQLVEQQGTRMGKPLCMLIKSPKACKKQLMKPIIEEKNNLLSTKNMASPQRH